MFFIGVFGVDSSEKVLKQLNSLVCPGCGRLCSGKLIFESTFFHIFFIPVFRWNKKYFLRTDCCGSKYIMTREKTEKILKGEALDLAEYEHDERGSSFCAECKYPLSPDFSYCPRCGRKIGV